MAYSCIWIFPAYEKSQNNKVTQSIIKVYETGKNCFHVAHGYKDMDNDDQ